MSHSPRLLALLAFLGALVAPHTALAAGDGDPLRELLLQAVNLVLVLAVIVWFGRKPVRQFFAARRSGIARDLESAAELLAAAEARNSEIQRRLVDLQSEIEEIRETARRRADDESERILAEARKQADRVRADARVAADQEFARASRQLRAEAVDVAAQLAHELLQQHASDGDRDRLLDEFITRVESGPGATA